MSDTFHRLVSSRWVYRIGLLGLVAAYLQGGLVKLFDYAGALGEMAHFGLHPAWLFAPLVIALELGASLLVIAGILRGPAALALAAFTLAATFIALPFWTMAPGQDRFMAANSFFEHLGLVGGFLLVAWHDARRTTKGAIHD